MKKLTRKTKRNIILGGIIVLVVLAGVLLVRGVGKLMDRSVDTTAGLEYIRGKEKGNVDEIETKISQLEQQETGDGEEDSRSIKEKFAASVVLGDSIPHGLAEFDILNATNVKAKIGAHLTQMDVQIEEAKSVSPLVVFISIGENDVTATNGDTELFIEQYTEVLDQISKELPEANIFVNSIFPVQQKAIDEEPKLADIPAYNEALSGLCESREIGFIDNTELVQDQYYEPDGQHFVADFYPLWAEHMAEVAAL